MEMSRQNAQSGDARPGQAPRARQSANENPSPSLTSTLKPSPQHVPAPGARRPSSPLRQTLTPNTPTAPALDQFSARSLSYASQRPSGSGPARTRRTSSLLHEIQPPSRRLSPHQVLLLTPFGGALPAAALAGAAPDAPGLSVSPSAAGMGLSIRSSGMSRGSSSMSRGPHSAPLKPAPGWSTLREGPPPPSTLNSSRARHHSLISSGPSPLASQPMDTIVSCTSSEEDTLTLQGSSQTGGRAAPATATATTVPMARSNSLPVLTLRELDALRVKDGELGIARGVEWAWVSRTGADEDSSIDEETPVMTSGDTTNSSYTSIPSVATSSSSSAASTRFPQFNDPFASTPYQPISTSPSYRYSPHVNDQRRSSETPALTAAHPSPTTRLPTDARRPSVPAAFLHRNSLGVNVSPLSRTDELAPDNETSRSPGGDTPRPEGSPKSVRLMRYKSSPGRYTGLGLDIVVRTAASRPPSAASSRGKASESSDSSRPQPQATPPRPQRPSRPSLGTWAAVDLIDSLSIAAANAAMAGRRSSLQSRSSVASSAGSAGSGSSRRASQVNAATTVASALSTSAGSAAHLVVVEQVHARSPFGDKLSEFGQRRRLESVDSALHMTLTHNTHGGTSSLNALSGKKGMDWGRRGSLAVLSQTPLGPWAQPQTSDGTRDWSERRGSWAEGWLPGPANK